MIYCHQRCVSYDSMTYNRWLFYSKLQLHTDLTGCKFFWEPPPILRQVIQRLQTHVIILVQWKRTHLMHCFQFHLGILNKKTCWKTCYRMPKKTCWKKWDIWKTHQKKRNRLILFLKINGWMMSQRSLHLHQLATHQLLRFARNQ